MEIIANKAREGDAQFLRQTSISFEVSGNEIANTVNMTATAMLHVSELC
jgi:hypothetical protein